VPLKLGDNFVGVGELVTGRSVSLCIAGLDSFYVDWMVVWSVGVRLRSSGSSIGYIYPAL
jgi:hypothetical protein